MYSNQFLELLAPARDLAVGRAAISHGADAVYIGASGFGARKQAGNSVEDIGRLADYAHWFGAKVFVALNTIIYEQELEQVRQLVWQLWNAGADALIVQDMGILEMDLPPIPLHASTQNHNFSLDRIRFFDEVGFQRLVMARELSLEELSEVRRNTRAELEYFIHGALCVSLSGQCYMSEAIGGRSANRGDCAQACRMPYNLVSAEGGKLLVNKHLLSLKDLNLSGQLRSLALAGVQSFKIEGRLKDERYVKNTVANYRKELDAVLADGIGVRASAGKVHTGFTPDLERSFHRSATEYFLHGRRQEMVQFDSPKSTGKYLGKIKQLGKGKLQIETHEPLANGDGLCFFAPNGELLGLRVDKIENGWAFAQIPKQLRLGAEIYRNSDQVFNKALEKSENVRQVSLSIRVEEADNGLVLYATDEQHIRAEQVLPTEKIPADKPERALDTFQKQLRKTGDLPFVVTEVQINSPLYFVPTSVLNEARRQLLDKLYDARTNAYKREEFRLLPNEVTYPNAQLDYKANVANSLARKFYERHGVQHIDKAFELSHSPNAELMTTRYCLRYEQGQCPKYQNGRDAEWAKPLFIENEKGKFRLEFDCKACLMKIKRVK